MATVLTKQDITVPSFKGAVSLTPADALKLAGELPTAGTVLKWTAESYRGLPLLGATADPELGGFLIPLGLRTRFDAGGVVGAVDAVGGDVGAGSRFPSGGRTSAGCFRPIGSSY